MGSFTAWGVLGKFIVVVPEWDAVIVLVNHTEYPDAAEQRTMSDLELRNLPNVTPQQMSRLLNLLIDAQWH
jgi:hypothetical protein